MIKILTQIALGLALLCIVVIYVLKPVPQQLQFSSGQFDGCYIQDNIGQILKFDNGSILINSHRIASFSIIPPSGGKHGFLLSVSGISVTRDQQQVVFEAGNQALLWRVDAQGVWVVSAPDIEIRLTKLLDISRCPSS